MNLLERLFGGPGRPTTPAKPDPLRDLVEFARAQNDDAWAEINRSRVRRGERPIRPDWNDMLRPREENTHRD